MRYATLAMVVLAICVVPLVTARSDDAEVLSYEAYVEMATPDLHHSCRTAWELTEGDEGELVEMIAPMIAISLYHRQVDLEALRAERGADVIQAEFYDFIRNAFINDPDALLAGVVDMGVAEVTDADWKDKDWDKQ